MFPLWLDFATLLSPLLILNIARPTFLTVVMNIIPLVVFPFPVLNSSNVMAVLIRQSVMETVTFIEVSSFCMVDIHNPYNVVNVDSRGTNLCYIKLSVRRRRSGISGGAPYSGVLEAAVILYKKFHFI